LKITTYYFIFYGIKSSSHWNNGIMENNKDKIFSRLF